ADVEVFYVRKLKIGPCNGDMSCWFKNPGVCGQDDDMQMLYPKFREADVIVWASPVYYSGVTGPLKNLMDRQLPLHIFGEREAKRQKIVLISSCSAWTISAFDPLLAQMKAIYARPDGSSDLAGALLRPAAEAMREMTGAGGDGPVEGILRAAREAGRQMAKEGRISEELQRDVSRDMMSEEEYNQAAREMIDQLRESLKKQGS
ncbi:MAG: flavodoxin family protein, partial [Methanosarcinales archaeon]|nr:flavodoxin family protein [Methanosarcinales archaeon]